LGQTYVYAGEWRIFSAGIATLRLEQAGQETRIVGAADAAGTISLLYHVHDRLESFFDSATFCSRSISRNTEEGFRRVNTNVTFDYPRGKSVLDQKNLKKQETKHEEHDIPNCVTDLLSGVYYVASLPLQQGKRTASRSVTAARRSRSTFTWRPANRSRLPLGPSIQSASSRRPLPACSTIKAKYGYGIPTMPPASQYRCAHVCPGVRSRSSYSASNINSRTQDRGIRISDIIVFYSEKSRGIMSAQPKADPELVDVF